ncbi:hypothetical protein [Vulcanisaeta distributa]|uniref:hypothetical protein n=1 Tax=Vulcanisaeta distributa TaxID=164451 RepID=UPI0006D147E3|nr:hypothetical protein [Vulcanisaeta distributa]
MRMVVKAYSCNSVNELLKRVNNHIDEVKRAFIEAGYEELIDSTYVIISRLAVGSETRTWRC